MFKILSTIMVFCGLTSSAMAGDFSPRTPVQLAQNTCGFYVVLGCGKDRTTIRDLRDFWGGPGAGGGAGLRVADTNQYPNFRNGFYCLIDGTSTTHSQAAEITWTEAVPDSYVKNGC